MKEIIEDVLAEVARQDIKWGIQHNEALDPILIEGGANRMAEEYEIPSESRAKFLCNMASNRDELTWAHIAVEELAEVVACMKDKKAMREELVQLTALCLQWIKDLE